MLVNNKNPAFHRIAFAEYDFIDLFPGVNEIPDERWALASQHPIVKIRLKLGEYEVSRTAVTPAIVAETIDSRLLDKWEPKAKPAVKKAIKAQREKLEAPVIVTDGK